MIDEHPELSFQSKKLVLPAPDAAHAPPEQQTQRGYVLPERPPGYRPVPPPFPPLSASAKRSWRNDPAYIVLFVAIGVVLIAGIVFVTFATNIFSSPPEAGNTSIASVAATPQGTLDLNPKFPTPGGSSGSTTSSQPPKTDTPVVLQPTASVGVAPTAPPQPTVQPTVQPTPTQGQAGQLTLEITNVQSPVSNDSVNPVSITASEPGVSVRLVVSYNVPPGFTTVGPQVTDGNGNVTLDWPVSVAVFGNRHATARLVAIARDQNGKQVASQVVTVQIDRGFGIGQ